MSERVSDWEYFAGLIFKGDIPTSLRARLARIDELIRVMDAGGSLRSRQVISMVIEQWERDNPGRSFRV